MSGQMSTLEYIAEQVRAHADSPIQYDELVMMVVRLYLDTTKLRLDNAMLRTELGQTRLMLEQGAKIGRSPEPVSSENAAELELETVDRGDWRA